MIADILNRNFVLEQLAVVQEHLEAQASPTNRSLIAGPEGTEELTATDFATAASMVSDAMASEAEETSGQPGLAAPVTSRSALAEPSIDDRSYFSRDPVISVFQSVLEEYFETREPEAIAQPAPATRRDLGAEEVATSLVTDRSLARPESAGQQRIFQQFSVTDPGWVSQLFAQALTRVRGKHAFNPEAAAPRVLQDRTRLLLVGDWGSGVRRAQKVGVQMRRHLECGQDEGVEQTAIHLGDIYYAGRKREVEKRFLSFWPVRAEEADEIASYSTNANHDMYSGGHAYYDVLLADPRFKAQETSSFFSLSNSHWRILGVDTAYAERDLQAPQPEWIREQAEQAKAAGQKLMLLSHHQLFTVYERDNDKLIGTLQSIGSPEIDAWFWGHEHRCMTFKPHLNVQYASCIGHGGVPVYMWHGEDDPYPEPGEWENREFILWRLIERTVTKPLDSPMMRYSGRRWASVSFDSKRTMTYRRSGNSPARANSRKKSMVSKLEPAS